MTTRRKILTRQIGLRVSIDLHREILSHRRRDEQVADTVRRLVRTGMDTAKTFVNAPENGQGAA